MILTISMYIINYIDKVQPNITLILNAYRLLLKSESPNIKIKRIKRHYFFFLHKYKKFAKKSRQGSK